MAAPVAIAASLVAPTAMAQQPVFDWSGFYVGGHIGGGSAKSDWTFQNASFWNNVPGDRLAVRPNGWLGGAQLGLNYQAGQWLVGIEGTWSWSDLNETLESPFYPGSDWLRTNVKSLYTVAARLGITSGQSLWYVKGGWVGGRVELSAIEPGAPVAQWNPGTRSRSGWVLGTGVEHMIAPNWIAGIEYNYIDLGSKNYAAFNTGGSVTLTNVDDNTRVHAVVARLSYLFATRAALPRY